jgi:glycosyltransferase involved in cell wall biosynthesis
MIKVSVIITCYNLGEYINDAVTSVLKQDFNYFEIIIVNDGSTDQITLHELSKIRDPKIKIFHTANQGLALARNHGIEQSNGEFICCLDADDMYHPNFLSKTVSLLEKDKDIGFVTTWVQLFGNEEWIWQTGDYNPAMLCVQNIVHVASLYRRECWEKVGGYLINLDGYEDWNFWISIVQYGYKWKCVKEPLFYYRKRGNSLITFADLKRPEFKKRMVKNNKKIFIENIEFILYEYEILLQQKNEIIRNKDHTINHLNNSMENKIGNFILKPIRRILKR